MNTAYDNFIPGGLCIVDDAMCVHFDGSTFDVSACPDIQPGDYVIIPSQDRAEVMRMSATASSANPRRYLFNAVRVGVSPYSRVFQTAASMRANGKSALTPDQAQAVADHVLSPREKGKAERRFTGSPQLYIPNVDALTPEQMRLALKHLLAAQLVQQPHGPVQADGLAPHSNHAVANPGDAPRPHVAELGVKGVEAALQRLRAGLVDEPQGCDLFAFEAPGAAVRVVKISPVGAIDPRDGASFEIAVHLRIDTRNGEVNEQLHGAAP